MSLYSYLPQDRLQALANGKPLPKHTTGSTLFADISGFTGLTESLRKNLGARHGAEELTRQLGAAYTSLIANVERYGGSVIGFAGDSMMCWFDSSRDGLREAAACALTCAVNLQSTILAFPELGLKIAIASGDARRFVVGDSKIQCMDILAGATVTRTAIGEHLSSKGEVLVDKVTAQSLGDLLRVAEWREDRESNECFALVSEYLGSVSESQPLSFPAIKNDVLKSWVHRTVFERETSTHSAFQTGFRPCVALFVSFTGINYEADSCESELNAFICLVQNIVESYEGLLVDITIGDKGNYAYINFGALSAHEDDARRAVKAALVLQRKTYLQLRIGITQGIMRVGTYGGETRKTFGALGDDVNLAARLMQTAAEGEILLSGQVHKTIAKYFVSVPRPTLKLKGKTDAVTIFAVMEQRQHRAIRLPEPNYALPIVGREAELLVIEEKLGLALKSKGQIIGIVAEAGMGKSRLVAEIIHRARRKGFVGYGGACQSDGIHTPYLAWKSIWQAFFDVDPELPVRKQLRQIEHEIEDLVPARVEAMPLLNIVLDLNIPENDFTRTLEPQVRQIALHALLEDCMKTAASEEPILVVIEDLHWLDALSHDLLEELAKALANFPVCFVLAYRTPQILRLQVPRLEALPHFTRIELRELNKIAVEEAIRAKLAQLYPYGSKLGNAVPAQLVETFMARTQGNPFYLEELLNYLYDRGLDPREPSVLQRVDLPDSLHTLILSRIDQLSEQEKTVLRVASIVGRLFRAGWLVGYYPDLGLLPQVKAVLDELNTLDITPLESPEPELAYLFKHSVTHEVTYESMPFTTRARLHEQLARYLESRYSDELPLDALVFHYGRSANAEKKREYLRKAGEAAQRNFANQVALACYEQLLMLLDVMEEKIAIHMKRGAVLELMGLWKEAEADYRTVLEMARNDDEAMAGAQFALGKLSRLRGDYEVAVTWLDQAKQGYTTLGNYSGLAEVIIETGYALSRKGEYVKAREILEDGLVLVQEMDYTMGIALVLNELGNVAGDLGDFLTARELLEKSLSVRRKLNDQWGIATALNNLGIVTMHQGDYLSARALLQESLALRREMGDKRGISISLNNLGLVALVQSDFHVAQAIFQESLDLKREIGAKRGISSSLINLGIVAFTLGDLTAARALFEEGLALRRGIGDKKGIPSALLGLGLVCLTEGAPEARDLLLQSFRLRQELGEKVALISSLVGVAGLALREGDPQRAAQLLGSAASNLKLIGVVLEPDIHHYHDQTQEAVRAKLGDAAFQSAWQEGRKWSLEETVQKVFDGLDR